MMSKNAWSPGPDQAVGEDVRVRRAALAADSVDVVDVLAAHVEEGLRHVGHELAFADAGLEPLSDQLVRAVDHGAGRVEERDLVRRLDLARVEHRLLAVADGDARVLERRQHRRLHDVDADRHVGHAFGSEDVGDLAGGPREEPGRRRDGAAQADHAALDVLRRQPRRMEAVMLRRAAEVPQVRRAAARQQRVAGHLVAGPLADVGGRDVADVVEVEEEQRAQVGRGQGIARPAEAPRPETIRVDTLFPVDVHRPGRCRRTKGRRGRSAGLEGAHGATSR